MQQFILKCGRNFKNVVMCATIADSIYFWRADCEMNVYIYMFACLYMRVRSCILSFLCFCVHFIVVRVYSVVASCFVSRGIVKC